MCRVLVLFSSYHSEALMVRWLAPQVASGTQTSMWTGAQAPLALTAAHTFVRSANHPC
ncbi:hypothetical protein BD414DRAFT_501199 [Trametes punicea]|nr:hypothetical protein BD414DRAFT_501199 [Trametes punicea]